MTRIGLWRDKGGATAVEFALVLPVLLLLVFGSIASGVALWNWNVLEGASAEAARCLAIQSPDCAAAEAACPGSAGACYAVAIASARGLPGVTADRVSIERNAVLDHVSYTSVAIAHTTNFLGYRLDFSSTGRFPNPN